MILGFLAYLWISLVMGSFLIYIFLVSLELLISQSFFLTLCATITSFSIGKGIMASLVDPNNPTPAEILNIWFYLLVLFILYSLFIILSPSPTTIVRVFFILIILKVCIETCITFILLLINKNE